MEGRDEELSVSPSITTVDLTRDGPSVVDLTGKVHQLPCCIKYDGPTSVSHYFKPKPTGLEVDGLRTEESHFRGRKLNGITLQIPQGYSGFVLGKNIDKTNEAAAQWKTKASFCNVTVWNHESMPSKDDMLFRAFHLFAVADALHGQVTAQDLDSINID